MGWFGRIILVFAVLFAGAFFGGGWYVAGVVNVGHAMEPAFQDGAKAFVNYKAYGSSDPRRGQTVLMRVPGEDALFIRRIIGLPGDTVEINKSEVLVNGQKLDEPWLLVANAPPKVEDPNPIYFPQTTVAAGKFFVLADNRTDTHDSRTFGAVDPSAFLGRVWTLFGMTF